MTDIQKRSDKMQAEYFGKSMSDAIKRGNEIEFVSSKIDITLSTLGIDVELMRMLYKKEGKLKDIKSLVLELWDAQQEINKSRGNKK